LRICYEASCGYGHLYDRLVRVARQVLVAHPGHLRLIFRAKRKNDRVDARKLATLAFLDQVPQVHVPSVDVRSWRQFIEFRRRTVAKRTRVKNALRTLLRSHGLEAPSRQKLWSVDGVAWLATLILSTDDAMLQRDLLLEQLDHLNDQIRRVEKHLWKIARDHPGVDLLQTIPGVGPRTAEAVVAYIDRPERFRSSRHVGSYFGLVPCQDQSAGTNRLGHITRQGPATVRMLLVEATWQGIRHSPRFKAKYEQLMRDDPLRRKIALLATAHWLVKVMHAMLRTGETWRELDPTA
jgi:transposase